VIDPVGLVVLSPDAVVTTLDGDAAAGCVAVFEWGRADAQSVRVQPSACTVSLRHTDIEHIVDFQAHERRPQYVESFIN